MKMPVNFAYAAELSKKLPGLSNNVVVDQEQALYRSVPEALRADVERYREMQYDLMFGQRYLAPFTDQSFLTKMALSNYNKQFSVSTEQTDSANEIETDETKQ